MSVFYMLVSTREIKVREGRIGRHTSEQWLAKYSESTSKGEPGGYLQWVAGVLLDAEDRELHSYVERWVRDVGLLVTQTHRTDEALVFDRTSGEVGPNKGRLETRAG